MHVERKLTSTYTFVSFFHRFVSRRQIAKFETTAHFFICSFVFSGDKEIQNRLVLACFEKTKKT